MKYIVLDLEWNQPEAAEEWAVAALPFEIIEIGAIKISENGVMQGQFSELVKPEVYHSMNNITSKLIHLQLQELERGKPFEEVMGRFLDWCRDEEGYVFCTWGSMDLTELQRNMEFYQMEPLSDGPIKYIDVQKIFTYAYEEDKRTKRMLEYAVEKLGIAKDIPFHRAFSDAYYTSQVMQKMKQDVPEYFGYISYDVHNPPADKQSEIKIQFDTYTKYISRTFTDKVEAMADREVTAMRCYLCHCNVKRKIKWFAANSKHYYCLGYCERHGFLKGKVRMLKTNGGRVFVVKTTKLISEEESEKIVEKKNKAREMHRRKKRGRA